MADTSRNYPAPDLNESLRVNLAQIQKQINVVCKQAEDQHIPVEDLRDNQGGWILTPLLIAKTSTLAALVQLNSTVRF
jgi:hypothetical protein